MDKNIDRTLGEEIDRYTDKLLQVELKTQGEISRRRWFGAGMLILAPFCMAVAAAPWPSRGLFDLATWSIFSIALLLIGGWQIGRASRDEIETERPTPDPSSDTYAGVGQSSGIRRVK